MWTWEENAPLPDTSQEAIEVFHSMPSNSREFHQRPLRAEASVRAAKSSRRLVDF